MACPPRSGSAGQLPLPGAGRDRLLGGEGLVPFPPGCSSSLFCLEAEMLGESKNRPREGGRKKGHPLEDACRVGPAPPEPCSGKAASLPPVSREQCRVTSREDHKIFQDTFAAHTSLKHSTEVPKVKPGGREEGLRRATWGHCRLCPVLVWKQLPVGCGSGCSGELLPHREACGVLRAAGQGCVCVCVYVCGGG